MLQVHNVTKQVEYRGEMMELTESLSHLPSGGQVLLSDTTSQLTDGRLHEIQLPAFTFQCAKRSLDRAQSRISVEYFLRPVSSKGLVSSSASGSCTPAAFGIERAVISVADGSNGCYVGLCTE